MRRSTVVAAFVVLMLTCAVGAPAALAHGGDRSHHPRPSQGCGFANGIKHVIYLQFDNTHLFRDRPRVSPSDLEQMPHLLGFMRQQRARSTTTTTRSSSRTPRAASSRRLHRPLPGSPRPDGHPTPTATSRTTARAPPRRPSSTGPTSSTPTAPAGRRAAQHGQRRLRPAQDDAGPVGALHPRRLRLRRRRDARTSCSRTPRRAANGDMTKVFGQGSPEWNEALASNAAPAGRRRGPWPRRTSSASPCTAAAAAAVCRQRPTPSPTRSPTSPAATPASRACSGRRPSTRPSPAVSPW